MSKFLGGVISRFIDKCKPSLDAPTVDSFVPPLPPRYFGRCLGGPWNGQHVGHDQPRYPIQIWFSTGEITQQQWDFANKYQDTFYSFEDSTWVWKNEKILRSSPKSG